MTAEGKLIAIFLDNSRRIVFCRKFISNINWRNVKVAIISYATVAKKNVFRSLLLIPLIN